MLQSPQADLGKIVGEGKGPSKTIKNMCMLVLYARFDDYMLLIIFTTAKVKV